MDKFAQCEWTPGPSGVPLLTRCGTRIVLERLALFDDGGDHVCVVGAVVEATAAPDLTPLRLSDGHDITPGHEAEERPTPDVLTD